MGLHLSGSTVTQLNNAIDGRAPNKGAPNLGVSLTLKTDADRLAYTPARGESVYATDTHLFYIGDGTTAGGVASNCGFTADQLVRLGIIVPRHTRWLPAMQYAMTTGSTSDIPKPLAVGNSITQGDGTTGGNGAWYIKLGAKLQVYTGIGTTHWQPSKLAVSGSYIPTQGAILADYQDPANFHLPVKQPMLTRFNDPKLVFLMEMRNSASFGYITPGDYALVLRAALGQIVRHNADPVFFIENPMVDPATGIPYDNTSGLQVNWHSYYEAGKRVASDMGASIIDGWGYFNLLYQLGVDLRPFLYTDGEHPNDAGYQVLAELAYLCLLTAPQGGGASRQLQDKPKTDGRSHLISTYTNLGALTTQSIGTTGGNGTTGTLNNDTSRASTLNQTGSGRDVYVIPSGSAVTFRAPGPSRGVLVSYLLDSHNAGRAVLAMNGTTPTSGSTTSGARWDGFASDGVTPFPNLTYVTTRQFDVFYSTKNTAAVDDVPGDLTITATGGQICVLGVTWVNSGVQSHPVWPDIANTGVAPVADTFADNSETARRLTTAGDSDTLTFFGTSLGITFESGPNAGKYNISVDGAAAGADVELWSTIGNRARKPATVAKDLSIGWHTAKITVSATKNVSSTGFDVKYGRVFSERGTPDPTVAYMPLASGETAQLVEFWRYAQIDKVISGTPAVQFTPGATTITLGTTGAAWVRLTR